MNSYSHSQSHATTFGVRVSVLPATVLDQLVDYRLRHALITMSHTAVELAADGAALSDRCDDAIAMVCGTAAKRPLIALRRILRQSYDPARLLAKPAVAAALGAELTADIDAFAQRLDRQRTDRARLPILVTEANRSVNAHLRMLSLDPRFDQGLAHTSPTLHEVLRRRPGRRELSRLAVLAARAAAKTNPLSTFTASGLGRFVPDGPPLRWTATMLPRSIVELGLPALVPLTAALTEPTVRVNPSAHLVADTVYFLGPPPAEELLSLPLTPPLRHCLHAAAAEPTLAELATGFPAPPAETAGYLRSLVATGLLLLVPDFDEHGTDPLGRLADRLPELDAVRQALATYEGANGANRVVLGSMLHDQLRALGVTSRLRDVVTEQSVIPGVVLEAGLPSWQHILDELAVACRLLAVFDSTLPFKLAVAAFIRERFDAGSPIGFKHFYAELVRRGHEAMRLHPATAAFKTTGLTEYLEASPVAEVHQLAGLIAKVRCALADRQQIELALDALPAWVRPVGSAAVYAQYGGGELFVDAVSSGFGRGRTQIRRLLSHVADDPLPVDVVHPSAPRYAEFTQTFASSLNQRELILPNRLDYPAAARLAVGVDDEGLPTLFDDGLVVRPVHGGLSNARQLPPVMALLIEAFGENPVLLRPDQPLQYEAGAGDGVGRVLHTPRLTIGHVVLRRATWVAQPGALPRRTPGQSDASYLLKLATWLAEKGIPPRFFVSVLKSRADSSSSLTGDRAGTPMYVDIGSPPLISAFERLAGDSSDTAVFSEVAPDPETAIVDHRGMPRVAEYVFELNCQGDGK